MREGRLHALLVALDVTVMTVALGGAYLLRYHTPLADTLQAPMPRLLLEAGVLLFSLFVAVAHMLGMYRVRQVWRYAEIVFGVSVAIAVTMALVSVEVYLSAQFYHRLFLGYFALLVILLLPLGRLGWKRWLLTRHARGRGIQERRLLFVGTSPLVQSIIHQIERHPELGYRIVATLTAPSTASGATEPEVEQTMRLTSQQVSDYLREDRVDHVIFANSPKAYSEFVQLVALCQGNGMELKRFIDVVGSGLGLLLLMPLFAVIAVAIKLDSPGPVLYRRRVIGAGGNTFIAYKFRSMVANAHEILCSTPELLQEYQQSLKISNDARVTSLGTFLRKTSLDEFPQLFNVLRGEMSLVGPRMLGDIELARYGEYQQQALSIRPGITGLWQVTGRHETTFEDRVALDMEYVDNWSLGLDLKILIKTIPAVFKMRGAR